MIYLAGPYTHKEVSIRSWRYEAHRQAVLHFCSGPPTKMPIFSPIVVGHNLLPELDDWTQKQWMDWCIPFLRQCKAMFVIKLPGWEQSAGVAQELQIAKEMGIPVTYIEADVFLTDLSLTVFRNLSRLYN